MTTYPFWIEHDENGNPINYLWVKIDNIPAGQTKTIYIHTDGSNSPNGDNVFDFFDDFDGSSLDTNKWTLEHNPSYGTEATVSVSNSKVDYLSTTNSVNAMYFSIPETTSDSFIVEEYVNYKTSSYKDNYLFGVNEPANLYGGRGEGDSNTYYVYRLGSNWTVSSVPLNDNSWSKLTFKYSNKQFWFYANSQEFGSGNYNYDDSFQNFYAGIDFWADVQVDFEMDYVFKRKYVANEPSVTVTQIDSATYKVDIINNETTDLNDYQVAIPLSSIPDITSSTQTLDVISEEPSGEIVYPYWIEHDENGNPNNYVWVKVDSIPASGTKTIYAIKESGFSPNGDAVFQFFDDFEGISLNTSKWTNVGGTPTFSSGIIYYSQASGFTNGLKSLYSLNPSSGYHIITYGGSTSNQGFQIGVGEIVDLYSHDSHFQIHPQSGIPLRILSASSSSYNSILGSFDSEQDNTFYRIEGIRNPDTTARYILKDSSANVLDNFSGTLPYPSTSTSYITLIGYDDWKADWVMVTKYTATEPTITVTDMGTYYKIDITNNEASELTDYQVAIPINDLDVSSTTESIKFTDTSPEQPSEVVNKALHFSHNC